MKKCHLMLAFFLLGIAVLSCRVTLGQGFDPKAVQTWQTAVQSNADRYGWSPQSPQVRWPCPPLRVVKRHSNNTVETFQLLNDLALHTVDNVDGIEKSIYLYEQFYVIHRRPDSQTWILKQASERDNPDDWKWSPGSRHSFSGSRTIPRVLVDLPCYPWKLLRRLDEQIPAECIQLISETDDTQIYRISPSDDYNQAGEIVLSKRFDFRPVSIILGDQKSRIERQFQYHGMDFTEFDYKAELFRLEGGNWVPDLRFREEFTIKIDDLVTQQEFELAHYGIELESRTSPYPSWWWLIMAGAVLIGFAIWVRGRGEKT